MTTRNVLFFIIAITISLLILSGCQPRFRDLATENRSQTKLMDVIAEEVTSPIWLNDNRVALTRHKDLGHRFLLYATIGEIGSSQYQKIDTPVLIRGCGPDRHLNSGWNERLPNGNVGYILRCYPSQAPVVSGFYEWDDDLKQAKLLFDLSDGPSTDSPAEDFTYVQDMTSLIYALSGGILGELFQVKPSGEIVQLVPNFFRAASPAWSPDGQWIAFLGNESDGGVDMDHITSYFQTRNVLFRPWDVYLLDMEGNPRLLVPGFSSSGDLQWKPGSNRFLSLVGEYGGVPGVWLIDVDTRDVIRVWDKHSDYSWSPDGQQMMVIDVKKGERETQSNLLVFPVAIGE